MKPFKRGWFATWLNLTRASNWAAVDLFEHIVTAFIPWIVKYENIINFMIVLHVRAEQKRKTEY